MKYTAYRYQIIKERFSITKQLFFIGILFFGIAIVLILLNKKIFIIDNVQSFIRPLFLIGSIPTLISYVYQFFDFERIDNKKIGHVEFNNDELIIDHSKKIKYHELTDIKFGIVAYFGERINMVHRNPNEQKSLGIRNFIDLTANSNKIKFNFKLESEIHLKELESTIFELVKSEKLKNFDSKTLIKLIPKRYKDTDGFKNFVLKQIVEKKINCTEGLLLHGYRSDKEAEILREKYCN